MTMTSMAQIWALVPSSLLGGCVVACAVYGGIAFLGMLLRQLRFLYTQYFRHRKNLLERYGHGSWAVVTGGSDGIGLGMAVELAKAGFNICLVSRTSIKLEAAKAEILTVNPSVKVRLIQTDFRHGTTRDYWDALHAKVVDLDVSILVNNVGLNATSRFDLISEQFLLDIVTVNCCTQMLMTRKIIGAMLARPARSAVISLSSIAGQRPLLYLAPYSASKAFNDFFSRALTLEFSHKIDFMSLRPGYVVSNMSQLTEKGGFVLDRYECAAGCLDKLGYVNETFGDFRHAIYARSYFAMPEFVISGRRRERLKHKSH